MKMIKIIQGDITALGIYGYPKEEAAKLVVREVKAF